MVEMWYIGTMKNHVKNIITITTPLLLFFILFAPQVGFAQEFKRDLYFSLRNDLEVIRLQEFLHGQGYFEEEATGNFLALTRTAVIEFQKREGIVPAAGYVGPLTRTRLNGFIASGIARPGSISRETTITILLNQIQTLQARLTALQKQYQEEQASVILSPTPQSSPSLAPAPQTTPPVFTEKPIIAEKGFAAFPFPLGPRYAYRVKFDWLAEGADLKDENVLCSPAIKSDGAAGKSALYYPEAQTEYTCEITVGDAAQNRAKDTISFSAPEWFAMSGNENRQFPPTAENPLKFGDIVFYNGTSQNILIDQVETTMIDSMNSTLNRNREIRLIVRDGVSSSDDQISKILLTFHRDDPKPGIPHKYLVKLPVSLALKPGDEKTISVWMEGFEHVISGTLKMELYKLHSSDAPMSVGGIDLILTK